MSLPHGDVRGGLVGPCDAGYGGAFLPRSVTVFRGVRNVPQRCELAVVVPISTEASREASVVVSCGCFWPFLPFLGPLCVACFLCQVLRNQA